MSTCLINMYRYYGTTSFVRMYRYYHMASVAVDNNVTCDIDLITSHSGCVVAYDTKFERVWSSLPQMEDLFTLDEEG